MVEFIFLCCCVLIVLYPLKKANQHVKSGLESDKETTQLKFKFILLLYVFLMVFWYFYFSFNEEHAQFLIDVAIVHLGLLSLLFMLCILGACYLLSFVVACLAIFFSTQYHELIGSMQGRPGEWAWFGFGFVFIILITVFGIVIGIIIEEIYKWLRAKYKKELQA